jgi:hypothetical protein
MAGGKDLKGLGKTGGVNQWSGEKIDSAGMTGYSSAVISPTRMAYRTNPAIS